LQRNCRGRRRRIASITWKAFVARGCAEESGSGSRRRRVVADQENVCGAARFLDRAAPSRFPSRSRTSTQSTCASNTANKPKWSDGAICCR
jgi:hypothetical protein